MSCVLVDEQRLKSFVRSVLARSRVPGDDAAIAADAMVRADMRGVHTHGVWYLPVYVDMLRGGAIAAEPRISILSDSPAAAVLDADCALGHVAAIKASEIAASKAHEIGVGMVAVRNSNHFGAAGYYTLRLAEEGLISVVTANGPPVMAAPGAAAKTICNQPISYGVPGVDGGAPLVLDIAMSTVAVTRIRQFQQRGEPIPEGWLLNQAGQPTTDPADLAAGFLAPMAGHKGWGLALLVEVLAGVLSGAGIMTECLRHLDAPDRPNRIGHFVLALDPTQFLAPKDFRLRMLNMLGQIAGAVRAPGVDRILVPGQLEAEHEDHSRAHGLEIESGTWARIGGPRPQDVDPEGACSRPENHA